MTSCVSLRPFMFDQGLTIPPRALVVVLHGADSGQEEEARVRHFQPLLPTVRFAGIECDAGAQYRVLVTLQDVIDALAQTYGLDPARTIFCAAGDHGHLALELLVSGVLKGTGLVGFDIPLEPIPTLISPALAKIRLVQHADNVAQIRQLQALRRALQSHEIDFDGMLLPEAAHGVPAVAARAGAAFLAHLVAQASTGQPRRPQ